MGGSYSVYLPLCRVFLHGTSFFYYGIQRFAYIHTYILFNGYGIYVRYLDLGSTSSSAVWAIEMRIIIYEQSSGATSGRPSTLFSHVSGILAGVTCYAIP